MADDYRTAVKQWRRRQRRDALRALLPILLTLAAVLALVWLVCRHR